MASSFNHNKKRSTALVYEFMVRHMARTMIDKDFKGYRRAHDIARRYFGPGTTLSRELELFDVIRSARGLGEPAARRVLREVLDHASRLDSRQLEIKKSNLIKEINYSFGKEFFQKYWVPEYRLMASLQLLINSASTKVGLQEKVDHIVQLEEGVVKYMTVPERSRTATVNPDVDRLVCALAAKKFQEKYGQSLNKSQRKLLESYVRSIVTGDSTRLQTYMTAELDRVQKSMRGASRLDELKADPIMKERLDEAIRKSATLGESVSSETVQELMLFQALVEELDNE